MAKLEGKIADEWYARDRIIKCSERRFREQSTRLARPRAAATFLKPAC
jgi:hypothetical protein